MGKGRLPPPTVQSFSRSWGVSSARDLALVLA
uniref:Uncharacterized protein n=1 Tax=Arundo donax TaxID=35708 RepID=A0A0A8ZDX2_ARUDO